MGLNLPILNVGQQIDPLQRLNGKLRNRIEAADGLHLLAKKLDAIGKIVTERKNIEQSSPDGKLAGFYNKIHPLEIIFQQHIRNKIVRHLFSNF